MDSKSILDCFIKNGILSSTSESMTISSEFQNRFDEYTQRLSDEPKSINSRIRSQVDFPEQAEQFLETDVEFQALYLTIWDFGPSLDHSELIHYTLVCNNLMDGTLPTGGVPEYFTPIRGDQIATVSNLYRRLIVYIWRQDCDPCETMRKDFKFAFDEPPEDVALFSVFGPECSDLLKENYSVVGGPTVLFMLNGRVDSRIMAPYGPEMLLKEVEKLKERTRIRQQ